MKKISVIIALAMIVSLSFGQGVKSDSLNWSNNINREALKNGEISGVVTYRKSHGVKIAVGSKVYIADINKIVNFNYGDVILFKINLINHYAEEMNKKAQARSEGMFYTCKKYKNSNEENILENIEKIKQSKDVVKIIVGDDGTYSAKIKSGTYYVYIESNNYYEVWDCSKVIVGDGGQVVKNQLPNPNKIIKPNLNASDSLKTLYKAIENMESENYKAGENLSKAGSNLLASFGLGILGSGLCVIAAVVNVPPLYVVAGAVEIIVITKYLSVGNYLKDAGEHLGFKRMRK